MNCQQLTPQLQPIKRGSEWCALAMGLQVAGRITPELLLCAAMKGAHDATTN